MSKKNNFLALVLAILSSILLIIGLYGLGIFIGSKLSFNSFICNTIMILDRILLILFVLNIIRWKKYNRQLKNRNGKEIVSSLLKKKEEVLQHIDQSCQSMLKSYKNVCYFLISFYLFQVLLLFANGLILNSCITLELTVVYGIATIIFIIVSFLMAVFIFKELFLTLFIHPEYENLFPLIYQFIKQICDEEGIKKDIKVILNDEINVCIAEQKHQLIFSIGIYFLKFYTKDEIRSIIYHELAHYKQEHTKIAKEKAKYFNMASVLWPKHLFACVYPKMVLVVFDNEILDQLMTIYYETKADDEVLKKNVGQEYATAEVKAFGLSYAFRIPHRNIEYLLSQKHQWDKEMIEKDFMEYLSFYNQHQDFFIFASKNHLEARMATHPNVKQRVDKFATREVDPTIIPSNEFDDDIFKFYQEVNQKILSKKPKEVFDEIRKDYEEFMSKKEKAIALNLKIDSRELISLLDQAYYYAEMEFAKACSQRIIDTANEDSNRAHYVLGMIEGFYEFNDSCIEHLQIVHHDSNSLFAMDAFNALGEYASITGKKELLESIREEVASAYDNQKERDYVLSIRQNDQLEPFTNEVVIHHLIEIVKDIDEIEKICIGTKKSVHLHCHQVIVFTSNKIKNNKKIDEIIQQIWAYLDLEKDLYNLTSIPMSSLPANHVFKKQPLCVYTQKEYKENQ